MNVGMLVKAAHAVYRTGLPAQARPRHLIPVLRALRTTGSSVATLMTIAAVHGPDTPAVIDEQGTLTYRELESRVAAIAATLHARHNIGPKRTVAVMCRNHRGFVEIVIAVSRLGADLLLLNTEFSGPQLGQVFARREPDLVVVDEEFLPLVSLQHTTVEELAAGTEPPAPAVRRAGSITVLTSGTTGTPKGAPRSPSSLAMIGPMTTLLAHSSLRVGDPILIAPPLFHGFGLLGMGLALFLRAPMVLRRKFDATAAVVAIQQHHVACLVGVPVMLHRILDVPGEHDLSSLHTVLCGAAPLRPSLATRALDTLGEVLYNGYGSSEIGIAAIATPADLRVAPGTVGKPALGVPVRVLDDAREPVPVGTTGTVFVGGPLVFGGYDSGGNKEIHRSLMNSGDKGHFDANGRLHIDGRADDMIVSGGENVYPEEVENTLATHPGIADVAVLGVDDDEFGQRLIAYVVANPELPPTAEELGQFVKATLARYKVPRQFVFLDVLPRTATGKLLRRALTAQAGPSKCG